MNIPSLSLHSEIYSATGNIAADGARKLLGTPNLDLLQTVIREAIQNCCDAAKLGQGPEVHLRLRKLTEPQAATLRQHVFGDLPKPESSEEPFQAFLDREEPWVLEICDFDTIGLAGPTRADRMPEGIAATDFIDFLRNVGSPRDTKQGGGTYGYGKTSLYLSSRCAAILVDTQTTFLGNSVRRILGCHLGSAHEVRMPDGASERRTGRHWWGVLDENSSIADPLEGEDAAMLSEQIGFPERSPERRGTSIMIVDPIFVGDEGETPEILMGQIAESILWNFWPRLMRSTAPEKKITVVLELDGEGYPLPEPEFFPPLDHFAAAMDDIRIKGPDVEQIRSQRPPNLLGNLAIRKGIRTERQALVPASKSIVPEVARHIAVMRPVELVVRYFEDDPLPDGRLEWAGVFVSDSQPEVEMAFSKSEPPAHDDWQPSILPKGLQRTYVNVAVNRIKEAAKNVAAPSSGEYGGGEGGPSLAKVSGQFGRFLDSMSGGGAGPESRMPSAPGTKKKNRITAPSFLRLEEAEGVRVAVFEATVHLDGSNPALGVRAKPMLVVDGGAASDGAWTARQPEILTWRTPEGVVLGRSETANLHGYSGDVEIGVAIPGDFAVTVKAWLEEIEAIE